MSASPPIGKAYICDMSVHDVWLRIILIVLALAAITEANGRGRQDTLVINRVFGYWASVDTTIEGHHTSMYMRYQVKTNRRNSLLLAVPQMYNFAQTDHRTIVGEYAVGFTLHEDKPADAKLIARTSTIRRNRTMIPDIYGYMTPNIYHTAIFYDHILSPFHRKNRSFYRYHVTPIDADKARIDFRRRSSNTQTVRGHAIADTHTGRIISCTLAGEYDLTDFELSMTMGEEGLASLLPVRSHMKAKFIFMGNKLRAIYDTTYDIADTLATAANDEESRAIIRSIRPDTLSAEQAALYAEQDSVRALRQRLRAQHAHLPQKKPLKDILWETVGENLIHRIRGNFGKDDKGFYKLSPIINPLYIGYSKRRGLNYRFVVRMGYDFSDNSDIYTRMKFGYSFKLRQLLRDIPITYTFDRRNNGFVRFRWTGGELVTNSTIVDMLKEERGDTIDWDKMNLNYFKHYKLELTARYDFTRHFGFETGLLFNRWTSVEDKDFMTVGKPTVYQATSWKGTATIRPIGWKGPIITLNYEHTIPSLSKKRMNFEKWELDCSYLLRMPALRVLSLRAGAGLYSSKHDDTYFLDFSNFRSDFIPGGWNDEWTGDFELLHRNWYNSSKYYLRMNATYESPMLLLSRLPLVGDYLEKERFYLSALQLKSLSHYVEVGYGFTNQLFSMGIFASFVRGEYYSMGCRFGFELFNGW